MKNLTKDEKDRCWCSVRFVRGYAILQGRYLYEGGRYVMDAHLEEFLDEYNCYEIVSMQINTAGGPGSMSTYTICLINKEVDR